MWVGFGSGSGWYSSGMAWVRVGTARVWVGFGSGMAWVNVRYGLGMGHSFSNGKTFVRTVPCASRKVPTDVNP